MRKIATSAVVGVIAICVLGGAYRFHVLSARHAADAAKAEHEAALADSEQITKGIKGYWDTKTRRRELENDQIQLKNDQLRYDIAGLEGKPRSRFEINRDMTVIQNDELAVSLVDDSNALTLDPNQTQERIEEHNRKYPHEKLAGISDITKEMEDFNSRVKGIIDQGNEKLRGESGGK